MIRDVSINYLQLLFIYVFTLAVISKLLKFQLFEKKIGTLFVSWKRQIASLIVIQETWLLLLFLTNSYIGFAALYAAILFSAYSVILYSSRAYVALAQCECFGLKGLAEAFPFGLPIFARNLLLSITSAIFLVLLAQEESIVKAATSYKPLLATLHGRLDQYGTLAILSAVVTFILSLTLTQNRELEKLETFLKRFGYTRGNSILLKTLSDHTMKSIDGNELKLSDILSRELKIHILIFSNEHCKACQSMFERQVPSSELIDIIIIVRDQAYARLLKDKFQCLKVFVDEGNSITTQLELFSNPAAVSINGSLIVTSERAIGDSNIFSLIHEHEGRALRHL